MFAELTGAAAAILGTTLIWQLDQSWSVMALVGTWSAVVGFYLVMIIQEWRTQRSQRPFPLTNGQFGGRFALGREERGVAYLTSVRQTIGFLTQILRNLVLEFGPAELLALFFLRPLFLTLALHLIPGVHWAVIGGKIAADLIFFTVAISSYELRQRLATKKIYTTLSQL